MKKTITVKLPDGEVKSVNAGLKLEELTDLYQETWKSRIVACKVNNVLRELTYRLEEDADVEFIDLDVVDGIRIYQRSVLFVFIRSIMEVYKDVFVHVRHSLNKGLYCEIDYERELCKEDIEVVVDKMREIIDNDEPFFMEVMDKQEAIKLFDEYHMTAKAKLLSYREHDFVKVYTLGWLKNYFYGYMVPSTGYLKQFEILKYGHGVILRHPTHYSGDKLPVYEDTPKIAKIFNEAEKWGDILGISCVANVNERIDEANYEELVRISEALHEKKVALIADEITKSDKRIVLIAGPSSSGKTTFANRLMIQLKVNGLKPVTISTDDYFVDRQHTPRDEEGEYDFESIDAVDIDQFNKDLNDLLRGEEVELPTFDFKVGVKRYGEKRLQIHNGQPIIIEGIHALNEKLTRDINKEDKFKIYISALTQLNLDSHNRIPTTDTRLLRRIVRDHQYRGHTAKATIKQWESVRRGEEKNIFPFQEEADEMFNSALAYELAVLKKHAEPLLNTIHSSDKEYSEAKRLLKFLGYFRSIDDDNIVPCTSILKEFIGNSCFR